MKDHARPTAPAASNPRPRENWLAIALTLIVALYGAGYLVWYLQTPLGRAPQLDSAENLALAGQIAHGTLAHEPFYRAMLYPAVLAIPLKLGLAANVLPAFASLLGLLCHFLITLGVAKLATQLWNGPREVSAGLLAAALWGLNPVALFYAVEALDAVPSLALAVWALVWWARPGARMHDAWVGGVLLGLAVAARAHFLPLVFFAPLLRAWFACRWKLQRTDAMAWAGAVAVLLILGGVQQYWGGEFTIMPTQGAYNFYAANRPGANGKYYTQQIFFTDIAPGENPARKEQAILYAKAASLNTMTEKGYWYGQALDAIRKDPGAWLKLMGKKVYYFLNDFDQYNNKTYAWHKAESPFLKWNFLGWGIIFVMAAGMCALRGRGLGSVAADFNCPIFAGTLLAFMLYAAGALLFYASGRFRLPLLPLLCVLAGGWMTWPGWNALSLWQRLRTPMVILGAALIAYSNFFAAHDDATFIQDELLSANAAAQVGDDAQAYNLAERVLARDPARVDARRIAVLSYFNLSTVGALGYDSTTGWKKQLPRIEGLETSSDSLALVAGAAYWKTGDPYRAELLWTITEGRFGPNAASDRALLAAKFIRGEAPAGTPSPDPLMLEFLKKTPNP